MEHTGPGKSIDKGPVVTDREINELWWNGIGYGVTAGAALVAIALVFFLVPAVRLRFLPISRLRPGTWTGREVFFAFCAIVGFPSIVVEILSLIGFFTPLIGPAPDPEGPIAARSLFAMRCANLSSPLGLCVTLGFLFAILFVRSRCRPHHLGLSWSRGPANIALGLLAFLVTTPIVLAVYLGTDLSVKAFVPTRLHPLAQLGALELFGWEWIFIAFQATVAAPLLEEIVFRGVLQGWLRRGSLTGHLVIITATLFIGAANIWYEVPELELKVVDPSPLVFAVFLIGGYIYWLMRLANRFQLQDTEIQAWFPNSGEKAPVDARQSYYETLCHWRDANASLAIYGSAMLFATFHSFAWPYPIPLFLLALVLGWLARRTQSLVGPITLHAAFNLVAFIGLYGSTHYGVAKGNAEITPVRPSIVGSITTSVPASQLPLRK